MVLTTDLLSQSTVEDDSDGKETWKETEELAGAEEETKRDEIIVKRVVGHHWLHLCSAK